MTSTINPRWEWRSFGRCFGEAESRLAKLTPGGVQESNEIYLLSGAGDNVKVRDALMDIKVLGKDSLTVSDRGLRHGVLAERFGSRTEPGSD